MSCVVKLKAKLKLGAVAALLLLVIGEIVLNRENGYVFEWLTLELFLETCPRNQIRIESFAEGNREPYFTEADYATITVDLATGELTSELHRSIPFLHSSGTHYQYLPTTSRG